MRIKLPCFTVCHGSCPGSNQGEVVSVLADSEPHPPHSNGTPYIRYVQSWDHQAHVHDDKLGWGVVHPGGRVMTDPLISHDCLELWYQDKSPHNQAGIQPRLENTTAQKSSHELSGRAFSACSDSQPKSVDKTRAPAGNATPSSSTTARTIITIHIIVVDSC